MLINLCIQLQGANYFHFHLYYQTNLTATSTSPPNGTATGTTMATSSMLQSIDWSHWNDTVLVQLQPGELLYIPPFWIHEVGR